MIPKPKHKSTKTLEDKLDRVYSKYIRLVCRGDDGLVECFTCGRHYEYKRMDCGHYAGRGHHGTRWMRENTQPQCIKCNRFLEGVKDVFALHLLREYGDDILQRLNDAKNEVQQYSEDKLQGLINYYTYRVKELEGG